MSTLTLGKIPSHGLLWVEIPAGSPLRAAALPDGQALACQFVPAAFPNDTLAGRLLVKAPPGTAAITLGEGPEPTPADGSDLAALGEDGLVLTLGDWQATLSDRLDNGGSSGFSNDHVLAYDAVDTPDGVFRLFHEGAGVQTLSDGPLAAVVRVTTTPRGPGGRTLADVKACYDLVFFKAFPLVQLSACFAGSGPARAAAFRFGEMTFAPDAFTAWAGGEPRWWGEGFSSPAHRERDPFFRTRSFPQWAALTGPGRGIAYVGGQPVIRADEGQVVLGADNDAGRLQRDITEYGPARPFAAWLVYGDETVDGGAWVGDLPEPYRLPADLDDTLDVTAGHLTASLRLTQGGADLVALTDAKTGVALLTGGGVPLFTLAMRELSTDRQIRLTAREGWGKVTPIPGQDRLTLLFERPAAAPGLSVALTALCQGDKNRLSWEMDIGNDSDTLSLIQADYPRLPYDAAGTMYGYTSCAAGEIREDTADMAQHTFLYYTSGFASMQYMAVWRGDTGRGLYYGIHDPAGSYKQIFLDQLPLSRRGEMLAVYPAEGIDEPANSQKLPGRAVWQLFDGDWYDASQIYRQWVLNNARWIPPMTDEGRMDVPEWIRTMPSWFNVQVHEGDWAGEAIEAARDLGVPTALHVYQWHQIPFDNDYPHYFPAKDRFLKEVSRLREAGLKIMPYINSRLWDTRDKQNTDWQFSAVGKAGATKDRYGNVVTESYGSREIDDTPVKLAVMCPTSAVWQETQREINRKLFDEVGVDAVYLDQIAAMQPILCHDKTHSHRAGGGSWWNEGYYNFMDHLRRVKPGEGAYTTECNGEQYMRWLDGYLTWHWCRAGQVPAFAAVYAGYIPMLGRCYGAAEDGVGFRLLLMQSLLFGEQMGWLSPKGYLDSPYRDLYRKAVRARHRYSPYFYAGQMERPPKVTSDRPDMTTTNIMAGSLVITTPAVMGGLWKCLRDGSRLLVLVNIAEEQAKADITLTAADGRAALHGDLSGYAKIQDGTMTLTLPPLSVVTAELKD